MIAVLTQQVIVRVEHEEEAATKAIELDRAFELGLARAVEQHPDVTMEQVGELVANLGWSVSIIPDEVLA